MPGHQILAVGSARGASLTTVVLSVLLGLVIVLVVVGYVSRRGGRR